MIFTPRADRAIKLVGLAIVLGAAFVTGGIWYYFTPKYTRVGYAPEQPVPFSHALHVGNLGMSCVYCHSHVEESPHANVPTPETCLNCHSVVKKDSPLLSPVRESAASGMPVPWKRVHKLPDYAYFNHSVHVKRGVSCVSCHGQVNEMKVVYQHEPHSMSWCLDCHRQPENHLRPASEVTNLTWKPTGGQNQRDLGLSLKSQLGIDPPKTCQGCHR